MVKPFNPLELSVRVKAILRRMQQMSQAEPVSQDKVIIGPIVVDRGLHVVTVGGKELHLTTSEFDILFLLASEPGRVLVQNIFLRRFGKKRPLERVRQ